MTTPPSSSAQYQSCYARLENDTFTLGNARVERTWVVREGQLFASGLLEKSGGRQWICRTAEGASLAGLAAGSSSALRMTASVEKHPVSRPALRILLSADDGRTGYLFRIFNESAGIEMRLIAPAGGSVGGMAVKGLSDISGVEVDAPKVAAAKEAHSDVVDHFHLDPRHLRLTEVTLVDQTDAHDTLAHERSWLMHHNQRRIECVGNLFVFEETLCGAGLAMLKLAPLPHARPVANEMDLRVENNGAVMLMGHGIGPEGGEGYSAVTIAYTGGRVGRMKALQTFQRQLRPYQSGRDGMFLSNTWGDRSRDARLNADFMTKEIDAGQTLGVDVVQIDDGWQRGTTANSVNRDKGGVWNGFWAADGKFWDHHEQRFPAGIQPLADRARAAGMGMGLWFAPDSSNDFANWERDAAAILHRHGEHGINYFKIDGVKAHTKAGERNLRRFFDAVQAGSEGRVVFDLDVTAEIRPGYFGMADVGPIFVENRYTDWGGWWPHHTLRNLWMLSAHVDPLRLRMELLNNTRNADKYAGDPLAPNLYEADYLFASVMFANPLGWFETSNLPSGYVAKASPLVKVWKEHRDAIYGGTIIPIGDEPDGTAWTGFASLSSGGGGYLLAIRELNDRPDWVLPRAQIGMDLNEVKILAGEGRAVVEGGEVHVHLPDARRYLFMRIG